MSDRAIYVMTGLVTVCIVILLLLNAMPWIMTFNVEKYLKLNDVRGMAVEHKKKLYTLSFNQQNEVIGYLNQSIFLDDPIATDKKPKLEITKIVIYRFGLPDLTITPIEYKDDNLIFSSPDWNANGLMKDVSQGGLKNVLAETFDP